MSDEYLERIEAKIDRVITTQAEHTAKLEDHSQRFDRLDRRVRAVEVTLETTVPQAIMQIAEGHAAHTRQIALGFEALHMALERHQRPLEDTIRDHTAILKRHGLS